MDKEYWIIEDGESVGPFSLEDLKSHDIAPTTKIWYRELEEWTKAEDTALADVLFPKATPPSFSTDSFQQVNYNPQPAVSHIDETKLRQAYEKGLEEGKQLDKDTDIHQCPPTYLVWSVVATVLCCVPLGIVSIIYASNVTKYFHNGEYLKAKKASDKALYWTLANIIVWMVTYPIFFTLALF